MATSHYFHGVTRYTISEPTLLTNPDGTQFHVINIDLITTNGTDLITTNGTHDIRLLIDSSEAQTIAERCDE